MAHVLRCAQGMDEDLLPTPPRPWQNRAHLTTIVGHAQLLRRWVARAEHLTPAERERVLRHLTAIEQAGWALHQEPQPSSEPTDES